MSATSIAQGAAAAAAAECGFRAGRPTGDLTVWEDARVIAFSLATIGSFFWVPAALVYTYRRSCKTRRRKIIFWLALLLVLFMPVRPDRRVKKLWIWDLLYRYLKTRVVGRTRSTTGRSIYACVPHGVFPLGLALTAAHDEMNAKVFNNALVMVADAIYHTPVIGQFLKLLGAVKASGKDVDNALKAGHSLCIAPGGIGEIYLNGTPSEEFALLKNRKGFVKRAIEAGCSITPVYVFGNTLAFKQVTPQWIARISRLIKASLVIFWGRFGLPIPFRVQLLFAVGDPITPGPDANVDAVHEEFCKALVDLFDHYKKEYPGFEDKTLTIV